FLLPFISFSTLQPLLRLRQASGLAALHFRGALLELPSLARCSILRRFAAAFQASRRQEIGLAVLAPFAGIGGRLLPRATQASHIRRSAGGIRALHRRRVWLLSAGLRRAGGALPQPQVELLAQLRNAFG